MAHEWSKFEMREKRKLVRRKPNPVRPDGRRVCLICGTAHKPTDNPTIVAAHRDGYYQRWCPGGVEPDTTDENRGRTGRPVSGGLPGLGRRK